jgi:type II secretory pathway pseudopilin PulG
VKDTRAHGFALIDLIFVCGIIGLLCGIALPRLLQARQSAGAASAIGSLRAINSGQLTYALTCGSGFYSPSLTRLGIPPPGSHEPYLSPNLTLSDNVIKSNYTITVAAAGFAGAPPTCNGLGGGQSSQGFRAAADPVEPTNVRFFASNANGIIWENTTSLLSVIPEVGEPAAGHPLR